MTAPLVRATFGLTLSLIATGAATAQADVDFVADVLPILKDNCLKCHRGPYVDARGRTRKPKAGLRLDGSGWILRGSDDGAVVIPGDPQRSLLYSLSALPPGDDDRMPQKGDPLTGEQLATLRNWITAGAPFGDWHGEGGPVPTEERPADLPLPAALKVFADLGSGVTPAPRATIDKAAGGIAQVTPIFPGSPLLRVEFPSAESRLGDAGIKCLVPLVHHITSLHLGRTQITDAALGVVARMDRLVRLDLSQTAITDRGLQQLGGMAQLRSLNLHGTAITDEGLDTLAKIASLRAVYLWDTEVTGYRVARLRSELPQAIIHAKRQLPPPLGPSEPQPNQRRRRKK